MNVVFEHIAAGGTGITNIPEELEAVTQLAIDDWAAECLRLGPGDKCPLYIGNQIPVDQDGVEVLGFRGLRSRTIGKFPDRMAEFWAIHTGHVRAFKVIESIRKMK